MKAIVFGRRVAAPVRGVLTIFAAYAGFCGTATAQETEGHADVAIQGYYLGSGAQTSTNVSGAAVSFTQYLHGIGVLSGSWAVYEGQSKIRTGDNYAELSGFSWNGMHWKFRGGDFFVPTAMVEMPFTNLFYPEIGARGFQIESATSTRTYGFFYGAETVLNGPRVPFRMPIPQNVLGGYVKQKLGERMQIAARLLRLTSGNAGATDATATLLANQPFQVINTAGVQALATVSEHLKSYAEASMGFGEASRSDFQRNVPSWVVGSVWENSFLLARANYVHESTSFLPLTGYLVGDRQGPFGEIQVRASDRFQIFASASSYVNNLEKASSATTFHSTSETGGISARLPFGFNGSAQLSTIQFSSSNGTTGFSQEAKNRQITANLNRQFGIQNIRITGTDLRIAANGALQHQRSVEVEDVVQLHRLIFGGAVRAQRLVSDITKESISGRASVQLRLGRVTAHAYLESGNDLTNRTLFATNVFRTTTFGLSARLTKNWNLDTEAFQNRLVTELNPESLFVLANNGVFQSSILSSLDQWSFYFRLGRRFNWGKPIPSANIYQYALSRQPLVGEISGMVFEPSAAGNRPVAGIPVRLDGNSPVLTGRDGQYRFTEVAEGTHKVALATEELPADFNPGGVQEVSVLVQPKRSAAAERLEVVRLTTLVGAVKGPAGVSAEGIVIRISPSGRYTSTDSQGKFFFENLREGQYTVSVDPKSLPAKGVMVGGDSRTATSAIGKEVSVDFQFDVTKEGKPIRKVF